MELLVKVFSAIMTFILSLGFGAETTVAEFPELPTAICEEAPAAESSELSFEDSFFVTAAYCDEIEIAEETAVSVTAVETAATAQTNEETAVPSFPQADYTEDDEAQLEVSYEVSDNDYTANYSAAVPAQEEVYYAEAPAAVVEDTWEEIQFEASFEDAAEEVIAEEPIIVEEAQAAEEETVIEEITEEAIVEEVIEETRSAQEIVAEESAWRGNYGRLYINEVGLNTAVFYTSDLYNLQSVVDADDSACMFDWSDGNTMIADHNYQGFEAIKTCNPGSTAELVTAYGTSTYTMLEIIPNGWNNGSSITYYDGTPISAYYTGCLVIYTCNYDGTITVSIWA